MRLLRFLLAMPIIQVSFPSAEEEERTRKFQVHKNYLGALHQYVETTYGVGEPRDFSGLLKVQSDMRGFTRLQRREPGEPEAPRRYLMMSWASEAQLRVHEGVEATILPYANAWAPVHSYFAVYMSCVAWLSAQGHADASDHAAVLAAINQVASCRRRLNTEHLSPVESCAVPKNLNS